MTLLASCDEYLSMNWDFRILASKDDECDWRCLNGSEAKLQEECMKRGINDGGMMMMMNE